MTKQIGNLGELAVGAAAAPAVLDFAARVCGVLYLSDAALCVGFDQQCRLTVVIKNASEVLRFVVFKADCDTSRVGVGLDTAGLVIVNVVAKTVGPAPAFWGLGNEVLGPKGV